MKITEKPIIKISQETDEMAVVDSKCRVFGTQNLRHAINFPFSPFIMSRSLIRTNIIRFIYFIYLILSVH